jgi:hypothetical protein
LGLPPSRWRGLGFGNHYPVALIRRIVRFWNKATDPISRRKVTPFVK